MMRHFWSFGLAVLLTCSSTAIAQSWECVTSSAQWADRCDHSSVVFDDKMWVLRGHTGSTSIYDIWSSSDGLSWNLLGTAGSMDMTYCFPTVVFNGFMLNMGGATC
ncbi:MAG: hypothetical protein GQ565_11175 [Candidatus Aegiribacteria sp.]|nr:hypothetical protein [Candidatus Aegiribacteria sp.]